MKIGFIGTGTMGSMLVQTLLHAGALSAMNTVLFNRTRSKALALAQRFPEVQVAEQISQVARQCEIIFLCVKPLDYAQVLAELETKLTAEQILISITSPVSIQQLENSCHAKVARCIPSVTNSLQSGIALYTFGERLTASDRAVLLQLFRALGLPIEIHERHTRIASDISSCGPAFLSLLLEQWGQAAIAQTGISATLVQQMLAEMLVGLAQLLTCGGVTTKEIIAKVAVPGGITAVGLHHLAEQCAPVFEQLTALTHAKYAEDCELVARQFNELSRPQY